jgi:hypothetical protein
LRLCRLHRNLSKQYSNNLLLSLSPRLNKRQHSLRLKRERKAPSAEFMQ